MPELNSALHLKCLPAFAVPIVYKQSSSNYSLDPGFCIKIYSVEVEEEDNTKDLHSYSVLALDSYHFISGQLRNVA